ncbi:CocE/NonD family hydrolase [Paracidobacterium acidisoli]|uniref:CocE/NonD family hydrolase n=1 Tax=Paracidobacterium acidisoli TaxID=2303751 RepID=A0A372IKS4_9BACT|nr:CocE/NonD family hydrolase [Paracidobacterium acidisoli]MBT9332878.1 CocE/NonD family hydrolase [Paracidobacterium acidisoli]
MLCSRVAAPLVLLAGAVLSIAACCAQQATADPVHVDKATLRSYAGRYRSQDEPDIILSFFEDGDHLYVESARSPRFDLTAQSSDTFTAGGGSVHYRFEKDAAGKVTGVRRIADEQESFDPRIDGRPEPNHFRPYDREEVMIPMRDGVRLHAIILRPKDTQAPLPFLMQRTPYGVDWAASDSINAENTELAQSGYIFVMEDIRGRYGSQGTFVMMRPIVDHHDPHAVDESTDTYDTVAWLLKHVSRNNGRVGVLGISYPGFLAAEAGIDPHPAVKAISPQAPMTDVWIGDDFFHNGAFRQSYGYDYVLGMESSKQATFGWLNEDAYDYFLHAGSFAQAGKISGSSDLPTWKAFLDHPSYDEFWRSRAVQYHLNSVTVPTLEVGGWWDQEDMWGPQEQYAVLEPHNQPGDPMHRVFLALGPWRHGGWSQTTRHLGALDFGAPVGDEYRAQIEAPFFAYYLKDQPGFDVKNTAAFQTGSDRWMRYDQWPPKNVKERDLYLQADGSLGFSMPADTKAFVAYTSDPADPVPYRRRPIEATYAPAGSGWYTWLVQDQRFLNGRKDVASWTTAPLDHDLTITGDVVADLTASTSGTDSDWVVKLIDEYPDDPSLGKMSGYELMIVDEIFRGRYREGYAHPEAIPANQPEEYTFSLHGADHVFLKGHRVMVQVQSSWFPLYDRNPQTFVPNIMEAQPADFKPAGQRIYAGSHIELPVAPQP